MENKISFIENPSIEMVKGFHSNGVAAGIKKEGVLDLGVVLSDVDCIGTGMFTTNKVKAAPVLVCKKHVKNKLRAVVVNSGNANACTGTLGIEDAYNTCKECAELFGIPTDSVLPMSTGVIGQRLPFSAISSGLSKIAKIINDSNPNNFAKAIMTTDTRMKIYGVTVKNKNYEYHIVGVAKGSGMIHPNMATTLSFLFTDAKVSKKALDKAFRAAVEKSFNSITVDGDMSTNDSTFLISSGLAGNKEICGNNDDYRLFAKAVETTAAAMARSIVQDGEGATKLVEIFVKNAKTEKEAKQVAMSVATSCLVKTAFYGEDANFGRILCAVGYCGVDFKPAKLKLYFDNLLLFKNGEPTSFNEAEAAEILKKDSFKVIIDLDKGNKSWSVWTSDLSHEYVRINADYRS